MKRLLRTLLFVSLGIAVVGVGHSGAVLNPGDIIVVDYASGVGGSVIIVEPGAGGQTLLSTGGNFVNPFGIAVDATGRIFVVDPDAGKVIEVDNTSGVQSVLAVLPKPAGIAIGVGNDLLVADLGSGAAPPAVYSVDKNSALVTLVASGPPLQTPIDVAINKFGQGYVLDRDAAGGTVFEIPSLAVVSTGQNFLKPHGIAVDQGAPYTAYEPGGIHVTDLIANEAILVDVNLPANANQTVESSAQNFSLAGGIAIGAWPSFPTPYYVADFGSKAVILYDPAVDPSANQTVISAGGLLVGCARLTVVPEQPVQVEQKTWGGIKGQYR